MYTYTVPSPTLEPAEEYERGWLEGEAAAYHCVIPAASLYTAMYYIIVGKGSGQTVSILYWRGILCKCIVCTHTPTPTKHSLASLTLPFFLSPSLPPYLLTPCLSCQHPISAISVPSHTPGTHYPLPTAVFRIFGVENIVSSVSVPGTKGCWCGCVRMGT